MNELDFNLLLKSIQKSERSLEKVYSFYYPRIVYHLGKKYGKALAEDVAQDFFKKLLEKDSFEYVKNPTAWVYLQCDSIAKVKIRLDSHCVYTDYQIEPEDEEEVFREEVFGDLYFVIKKLDVTEQKITEMYYWEGYKLKEIAEILGLKYSSVKQKYKRLIKKIKNSLLYVTFLDS